MATTRLPHLDLPRAAKACGTVALPGSKSISNRVLLLAALAQGRTEVRDLLASDDTAVMRDSLAKLGVALEETAPAATAMEVGVAPLVVQGVDGRFAVRAGGPEVALFVGNSGLTIRTLVPAIAASLAATGGTVHLSGVPRMHERPIGDLVGGLEQLGARVHYLGTPGFPPLAIEGTPLRSGVVQVKGDTSSQYLTGLLQAAPLIATTSALVIEVVGELISKPYIEITLNLMARFGVQVEREGWSRFTVAPGQRYTAPGTIAVEGDASSASYFLAAGAIGGGPVRVTGAGRNSIQGDVRFADALAQMGANIVWGDDWIEASADAPLRGIDLDCNHIPDAAMTLAVCALHAQGGTRLRNIGSWRVKETDRLAAMATELRKLGATVGEGPDWITIEPPERLQPAQIATYDDHRMAMCFSLAALDGRLRAGAEVRILDPDCVAKTFPDYFERFAALTRPAVR